jgi:glycosyltransferase involved in cell wall biosynthesis
LLQGVNGTVVGNGAADRYADSAPSPACKQILFMGPFRYQQNYTGILSFLAAVWPMLVERHPDAELVILGGPESSDSRFRHSLLHQRGVRLVSAFVDPGPALAACALTINPQQEIRGSALKVAEALLARRICVSTTEGARGFDQLKTDALRICTDWQAMLSELDGLLGEQSRRHALEQSSEAVRAELSWDGKAHQLLELYRRLVPASFSQELAHEP